MVAEPYRIVIRPVLTEKSSALAGQRQYLFEVHKEANKIQIRAAVEEIFSVLVTKVNTMNVRGKPRRRGGRFGAGRTRSWKKAMVTLAPGQSISLFEGS